MKEQKDKDEYHYIIQIMWKTLQDKIEIRINLEETWKKQRQKEVNNRKEIEERLMTKTKMKAWTLLDKRANYIL